MIRFASNRFCTAHSAFWLKQLSCIVYIPARITLVTLGIFIAANRAGSCYLSVCKESRTLFALQLSHCLKFGESILMKCIEYFVSDFCLLLCWCSSELWEVNIKIVLYSVVFSPVFWAYFFICEPFLNCFYFSSGALLIGSTDVNCVIAHLFAVSVLDISG